MKEYTHILSRSTLFSGMSENDIITLTEYLGAFTKDYKKGQYVHHAGENVTRCGIILSGQLQAQNISYDGHINVSAVHHPSDVFGDVLMSSETAKSPVDVVAVKDTKVLFIPFSRIMTDGAGISGLHRLRMNLLNEISGKYFSLRKKISYLSAQGVREKIILFLYDRRDLHGQDSFSVGMSREQMANLLGVNRSALSRELSRMKDEGLIDFERDRFRIINIEDIR